MARARLIVLALLVALLAPWLAPCLVTAPAGHAQMPCCSATPTDDASVRPCCTGADQPPLVPPQAPEGTTSAIATIAIAPPLAASVVPLPAATEPFLPLRLEIRSTVLLI